MPPQKLRPYQEAGLAKILDAYREGARSVLVVSPTGSGKTTLFTHMLSQIAPSLLMVHRRELADQAANRLREFRVPFGFLMAGEPETPTAKVQIGTIQSLVRRRKPKAKFVVCDEAHLSTADTWTNVLSEYPQARILGVTATPWRLGGKPLVGQYDASVVVATPRELREQGHLCPYVGFSYLAPDLSKVEKVGDDYNQGQAGEVMSGSAIVDSVVEEWLKHASTLSTVVFAVTVKHSLILTDAFRAAGVAAEHLDGKTSLAERRAILSRVERGVTRVLCNVGVAVEGLDIPRLKCCVLARPTKSLARAIQMAGRVRRPWAECRCGYGWAPSADIVSCPRCRSTAYRLLTARIHDHAFVVSDGKGGGHGQPDADRDFSLHAKEAPPKPLRRCSQCFAYYEGTKCEACSFEAPEEETKERELNLITDAEQVMFASGDEQPVEPIPEKPPVKVTWNDPGRMIEGILSKEWVAEESWGKRTIYLIEGKKRAYEVPGTTMLDRLMQKHAKLGDGVRVTYTGEAALSGDRFQKTFKLAVDRGLTPA